MLDDKQVGQLALRVEMRLAKAIDFEIKCNKLTRKKTLDELVFINDLSRYYRRDAINEISLSTN